MIIRMQHAFPSLNLELDEIIDTSSNSKGINDDIARGLIYMEHATSDLDEWVKFKGDYQSGKVYQQGAYVLNDNSASGKSIWKANQITSATWVGSEWTEIMRSATIA